jgi:rhamnosyltransferase
MISIIIPTLNAAGRIRQLVEHLLAQSEKAAEIIVVDSASEDGTAEVAASLGCSVHQIDRRRFDHGGNRNFGADKASGGILVFLTQDALPASPEFLERLTAPIREGRVAGAYARQIPAAGATPLETFARLYNYPPVSSVRHLSHLGRRTLRSFFFSNVASAVSRAVFESVGRFPTPVPSNEDMLLCARLLDAGHRVAYVAEAEVFHSHSLTFPETFRRYFRTGLAVREYRDTLGSVSGSGDGVDFVSRQIAYLWRLGRPHLIPRALTEAGVKALAYYCGQGMPISS